jgi:basic membrane lipoprotein Med (substrate-binding protein (PBP1-ABC) superfamily)
MSLEHTGARGLVDRPGQGGIKMSVEQKAYRTSVLLLILLLSLFSVPSCQKKREKVEEKGYRLAVFVPGITEGSPIYEMLVEGARRAVQECPNASENVVEGGFNQAEWQEKITTLAATGTYDLILTSNPAMPSICVDVAEDFPNQRFAVMDSFLQDSPQVYTVLFNQMEQAYLIGYMGGLVTKSSMPGANPALKVGLIAGQHYPIMDRVIKPGFERGLKDVDAAIKLDFRIVGNWHDAGKAAELAQSMIDTGTDVILTIAGGANLGVIKTAKDSGRYVLWFDSNGYGLAPGTVVGSTVLRNDRAAYETVKADTEGKLVYGKARLFGIREGYIDFVTDDENFRKYVSPEIRDQIAARLAEFKSGARHLAMPRF